VEVAIGKDFADTIKIYMEKECSAMSINFKHITETIFIPAIKDLGFKIKSKSKNNIDLYYNDNESNLFELSKFSIKNAVSFSLFIEKNGYIFSYPIRHIALVKCDKNIREMFEHPFDNFYYDNDDELIGIYDFVYGLMRTNMDDFFYGNLLDEINVSCINIRNKLSNEYKNYSEMEKFNLSRGWQANWEKIRFSERQYL
jgi:hypothetical protein